MKKLTALFFSLVMLSVSATAQQFEEGKHYEVLDTKASSSKQVIEFFSFGCGHCNNFEPVWQQIASEVPKDIKVKKSHVSFIRFTSQEMVDDLTRAVAVADILKVKDKVIPAIFNYVHVQKATFRDRNDIRNIFVIQGVDGKDFDKYIDSFPVSNAVRHMEMDAKELKISGVPSVIVNNKYKILGGVKSTKEYADLIAYLANKK